MFNLILAVLTQTLTFMPLAFGISISYHIMRATDMTIDGSFVLGAALFAALVTHQVSPYAALVLTIVAGALAGCITACIQRQGRIDALLAGVLTTFMLTSVNLIIMGKPNINLLNAPTLLTKAFAQSELIGWLVTSLYIFLLLSLVALILNTPFGLRLRAFACNPPLFARSGYSQEHYRLFGFALTNALAASSGCFTAQVVGYADVSMGLGMTLTGIGAIILGQQFLLRFKKNSTFRLSGECLAALFGVLIYYLFFNSLIRLDLDPTYLKLILSIVLILFLRIRNRAAL